MVAKVIVSLQLLQSCPAPNPGIDMQRVQCLMEEMGTSLSPGAQNLMEMVQFQQKVNSLRDALSDIYNVGVSC